MESILCPSGKVCDERKLIRARAEEATDGQRQGEARMKFSFYLLSCIQPLCLAVSAAKSCSKNWIFSEHYLIHGVMNVETKAFGRVSQLKQFILNWVLCGSWIHSKACPFCRSFTVDSDAKGSRNRFVGLSSGVMDVAGLHRCLWNFTWKRFYFWSWTVFLVFFYVCFSPIAATQQRWVMNNNLYHERRRQ